MRYFIFCFILLTACAKKDTVKPTISFSKPAKDTISVGGTSVPFEFKISDDDALSNYTYVIKNESQNKYKQLNLFTNNKEIIESDKVDFGSVSGLEKITIYVQAYDKVYNQTQATKTFYITP